MRELLHLIIDTKFYRRTLMSFYGLESVYASNLYQLFSYLVNAKVSKGGVICGMLLYPRIDRNLRLSYQIHGFDVRVYTVDLNQGETAGRAVQMRLEGIRSG